MKKAKFEYIESQFEVIIKLCNGGDDFAMTWKKFLESCGWTEEEYQRELDYRLFDEKIN